MAAGDTVQVGQPVAAIEAMKMESVISAPIAGTIDHVAVTDVGAVTGGDLLIVITPSG